MIAIGKLVKLTGFQTASAKSMSFVLCCLQEVALDHYRDHLRQVKHDIVKKSKTGRKRRRIKICSTKYKQKVMAMMFKKPSMDL